MTMTDQTAEAVTHPLLDRLRSASCGSRELDADIRLSLLGDCPYGVITGNRHQVVGTSTLSVYVEAYRDLLDADDALDDEVVPRFTSSLDAALGLVARNPGYFLSLHDIGGAYWEAHIADRPAFVGRAPTAPLALLIALFTALANKEAPNE